MSVIMLGLQLKLSQGVLKCVVELFSLMCFVIVLLVVLLIVSIIGMVLIQDDLYLNYVNQFGLFWVDIFCLLGLYNVYSVWWFMLILIFFVVLILLCVICNVLKMFVDVKSWKDKVCEGSLCVFYYKVEYMVFGMCVMVVVMFVMFVMKVGYKYVVCEIDGVMLIFVKCGVMIKWGYIFVYFVIVVICIGGLFDSNLLIKFQMWMFGKSLVNMSVMISEILFDYCLFVLNLMFCGYVWVLEGQFVLIVILNQLSGLLIQDLLFLIQFDKFIVDYYMMGMLKLFVSDIVVIDCEIGWKILVWVEVNKLFMYKGVLIYQLSFQDGGL